MAGLEVGSTREAPKWLADQSPERLQKMVKAPSAAMPGSGLGSATYAAALDIIDAAFRTEEHSDRSEIQ